MRVPSHDLEPTAHSPPPAPYEPVEDMVMEEEQPDSSDDNPEDDDVDVEGLIKRLQLAEWTAETASLVNGYLDEFTSRPWRFPEISFTKGPDDKWMILNMEQPLRREVLAGLVVLNLLHGGSISERDATRCVKRYGLVAVAGYASKQKKAGHQYYWALFYNERNEEGKAWKEDVEEEPVPNRVSKEPVSPLLASFCF